MGEAALDAGSGAHQRGILTRIATMGSTRTGAEIPDRAYFKAQEVCELAQIQPYVLRSWEAEFPGLGVNLTSRGVRLYRPSDVERVLLIKRLLFVDGLTLAGARRRLEEQEPAADEGLPIEEFIGQGARESLERVKVGLRSILDLLSDDGKAPGEPKQGALLSGDAGEDAGVPAPPKARRGGGRRKPAETD